MDASGRWSRYYEANAVRGPRDLLLEVLASFEAPGHAVDLGFGNGIETVAMLERGWSVVAVDPEAEAKDRLLTIVPAGSSARLDVAVVPMEEVELPQTDLVWAGYSLFFCDPARFPRLWAGVAAANRSGGRFAGQLLGDHDTWAAETGITSFDRAKVQALFEGWTVERLEEDEGDGESHAGPKHWHLFHAVARR
jgi:SAM-dependent methyltransferase